MDAGNSSEWLPPGFAEKTEVKNGRNVKYYYNVTTGVKYHSKKDVIHCATEDFFRDAPLKTNCDDNGESSDSKFDAISVKSNKSPKWLPDGWRMEEKIRKNGSSAGSTYKVYIDSSTGYKFYSKLAVARYLKTIDQNDAATEQPKFLSAQLDNVGEPSLKPDMSLRCKSSSEVDCLPAKELKREKSFTVVASNSTSADGLPPSEAGSFPRKKSKRKTSFTMVNSETTSADAAVPPLVAGSTPRKISKRKKSFDVVDPETTSADAVTPLVAGSTPGKISKRKNSFTVVDYETTSADAVTPLVAGSTPGKISKRKDSFIVVDSETTSADAVTPLVAGSTPRKISKRKDSFTVVDTETTSVDVIPPSVVGSTPGKNSKRKKSFTVVNVESTPADGLPPGWVKEIKTSKSGNKIRKDPYYVEPVNGYMFLSKKDALRYLETNNIGSCACMPKRKEFDNLKLNKNEVTPDNVGVPFLKPDTSPLSKSMTDTDCIPQKRNSKHSFALVASESTSVEGLPHGWIKEIMTRKSGNKIRKDAYYTDPITGYMFRSKSDALRYVETSDIDSCAIKPKKRELGDLMLIKEKIPVDNVGFTNLKPDAPSQCKFTTVEDCIAEKKNENTSTMARSESTSADGLPPGWIKEVKTSKSGNKIRKDSYYIDPVNGYVFLSKKDVMRYLETNDIGSCAITPKKRKLDDFKLIKSGVSVDSVGETFSKPQAPLQFKSVTNDGFISEQNKDKPSIAAVAAESSSTEGLPPGWIKEIRTSKSGNKIRKDPYYTDPVSGYVFRSKKDVMRYLETNNIGSCAITPKRRGLDDLKKFENKISLNSADEPQMKPEVSVQNKPNIDASDITEPKKEIMHSSYAVVTETASADGLPPGWIKEIKTIQFGDKIRKDPYYTDPASGYVFRSKKDVFRFLKTNDIRSCAIRPKKRETEDLKLIKNINPLKNVARPHFMPDVSVLSKAVIDTSCITETKKKFQHSSTTAATEFTTDDDLPPGWIKEIKTSESGDKIRKDLYYTDPVSGYIFRSKKDVLRFLDTNDIRSCAIRPKRRETDDFQSIKDKIPLDNSGDSALKPEASMKCKSMIDAACITEIKKISQHPSSAVATEIASTDGLPPGWIKEIKTSQSGDKIRKDPLYTDPVSGYIFRSKKDVLRYLETNDISSCAIRPKRRERDGPNSVKKKTSSSPVNKKLSKQLGTEAKLFVGGESNTNGAGGSVTKTPATSKANTLIVATAGSDSFKGPFSCENSNKLSDMKMGPEHTKDCSKQGENAMADVLAICSSINDAFTEEKLPESEIENRTRGTRSEILKSKKRRDLNLPLRASKRLAKSQPEMLSNVELSERTRWAATKRSAATSVPLPSDFDPKKEVADHANAVEETLRGDDPLNNVEKPLAEGNTTLNEELSNKAENPLAEDNADLKEQTEAKTNGKQPNDDAASQDTQPCYEFGDSWTDPCLEFAYKTLTGEIPLDDTLPFPEIPYNQEDGGIRPLPSGEPTMFESEIPPGFESTNQNNTVEKVPASPSFYLSAVDALFESEIPPGFESVAQNKNADKSPANPSLSSPQVSTETGFSDKSS
ncbi:uncharacterized protein [Primulina eburnea]|uniref:uncharacterized protein isoform X2 n=1 Tax=Primulina eburnea TaxID=1245227 RepID=UPI003C6BE1A9